MDNYDNIDNNDNIDKVSEYSIVLDLRIWWRHVTTLYTTDRDLLL